MSGLLDEYLFVNLVISYLDNTVIPISIRLRQKLLIAMIIPIVM